MDKKNRIIELEWNEFYENCHKLSLNIKKDVDMEKCKGLIAVTRGGLAAVAVLSHSLGIKNIDVIGISSYDDGICEKQKKLKLTKIPSCAETKGKDWIVVDELCDSGKTIEYIKTILPEAYYAVVTVKMNSKKFVDSYGVCCSDGAWIVYPWEQREHSDSEEELCF